ncbi:MAG: hypothetical protein WA662_08365, partial [Pseudolabrys sp.]
ILDGGAQKRVLAPPLRFQSHHDFLADHRITRRAWLIFFAQAGQSLNEIRATDDSNYPLLCDKRQALATAVPEFVVLFRVNIRVPMLAAQDSTGVAETF